MNTAQMILILVFKWFLKAASVLIAVYFLGFRMNATDSLPKGLYRLTASRPSRGSLVEFRPPAVPPFTDATERGYISHAVTNYGPGKLFKRIVAIEGDTVTVNDDGVFVNGVLLPNSRRHPKDAIGRPLPCPDLQDYVLRPDEVFLFSEYHPDSFDGRYFGVQPLGHITGVIVPVLTFK